MNAYEKKLEANEKRMEAIVNKFQEYVASYSKQVFYKRYSDETFLNDMLYGIGIAFNIEKFEFNTGYNKFKAVLKQLIETQKLDLEFEPNPESKPER